MKVLKKNVNNFKKFRKKSYEPGKQRMPNGLKFDCQKQWNLLEL